MDYWTSWKRRREKKYQIIYKRGPSTLALVFAGMALSLWAIFALLSSYPIFLYFYYTVVPGTSKLLSSALAKTGAESQSAIQQVGNSVGQQGAEIPEEPKPMITRDPSLPEGQYMAIPTLGIDTAVLEASSSAYEEALRRGVWRVPEFATPETSGERPVILAAHRFGYVDWTQSYREKNSFYKLPEVKVGESIVVTWNQHRYTYKVTKVEEGTEITDYSSDLILYTCKFLVSPIRIIVYAELV
ncbi:MAG: sortase [Candidatus Moraniibacteriota bacterium]|nr:MAG: sortase [Candidatus Moranbacteria bacterium]